jgi:hypothetical protein
MVNMTARSLYPAVRRRHKHFSTLGCVIVETVIDGYGKYGLNWISNNEYSSPYRIAVPNTVPQPQIFNSA